MSQPAFSTCDLCDAHEKSDPPVVRPLPPVFRNFGAGGPRAEISVAVPRALALTLGVVNASALVSDTIHFFKHESCGKCTPCREGTFWMARVIDRIEAGKAGDGDIDLLYTIAKQMQNKCLCALGEFSTVAVMSAIQNYRADFAARLEK